MRNTVLFLILLIAFSSYSQSERQQVPCASDALLKNLIETYPEVKERLAHFENILFENSKNSNKSANTIPSPGSITIPIVVYVVHDGTATVNISDAQVNNQISALNTYFLNTGIKFCLATKMNGTNPIPTTSTSHIQTTPGIIHINNTTLSNHNSSSPSNLVATASPLITKERYLRIWVVKSIDGTSSGIAGYSMFPNTSPIFDGIVMRYNVFGNGDANLLANYNLGKVLAHEVGHYLGLYHTFEGSCSINFNDCLLDGDHVCDTPTVAAPNFNCISETNSCTETPAILDDLSNYMDYGNNNCQNHFTNGQIERMLMVLNQSRHTLYTIENIIYTGTCGFDNLLSATITPSDFSPCTSLTTATTFTAPTAATYQWNFGDSFATGSNPNTASTQSASHIFTSSQNSPYTVTLTVTNSNGDARTSTQLIYVTNCTPINNTNSYWYVDNSCGLNFSSGRPIFDPTFPNNNFANTSCNAQCDTNGNLLFYTNKKKVWNKLHVPINNTDLMLTTAGSTSNQVLIVPKPPLTGNVISEYYIFTKQIVSSPTVSDLGFRYNIVNVTGTTATMGVIGQPITLPATYGFDTNPSDGALLGTWGLSAVKKCTGNDYWILALLRKNNTPYLVVFSLTNSGLTYNSETAINTTNPFALTWMIEVAPNGNKIFLWHEYNSVEPSYLLDFNKAEGIVDSFHTSLIMPQSPYASGQTVPNYGQISSCSFSLDSNLLYVGNFHDRKIFQFNLNTIDINNSRKEIASTAVGARGMQMGPDNKLYIAMANDTNNYQQLSVVHNPNALSTSQNPNACNFSLNGPKVNGFFSYRVGPSLPNIIDAKQETAYFNANTPNVICKYITACNTYKFFPNVCGASFIWTFTNTTTGNSYTTSVTNPTYNFTQNGTYIVTLKDTNNVIIGTSLPIEIATAPIPIIAGSTTACLTQVNARVTNNSTTLAAGESVVWSINVAGSITGPNNQASVNVNWSSLPGVLTLTKTNSSGCISVATRTIEVFCPNLSNDVFSDDSIKITPNPSEGVFTINSNLILGKVVIKVIDMQGRIILEKTEPNFSYEKTIDLLNYQSGIYIIKIEGAEFSYSQKIIKN